MTATLVRAGRWVTGHLVMFVALLVLLYMFLPIMVVVLMSFDDTADVAYQFNGFTLANWSDPCSSYGMCDAVAKSLQIGLLATVGATLLGTLMAFAMARHHFRGRSIANVGIFLPMASPEIVMGSSLLALFVSAGFAGQLGFATILIAHIMFCLSFVVVAVKARLSGMDNGLEQAAMDLYANEWQTFWRVTFPLVFPGIVGAALLAFSLSFDDYIITNLVAGQSQTFPMYVWGVSRREIPPQINVIGTAMLLVSILVVVMAEVVRRGRNRA
ncbi:MAG: ABC transporter permease [Nocardioidaceae bacterium]